MKNRTPRRVIAASALLAMGGGLAIATTTALPAQAYVCDYQVIVNANVRENPSINSVVRKVKPAGSIVGGNASFCGSITGTDGRQWVEVNTGSATDGRGYIIANKVTPLTPT